MKYSDANPPLQCMMTQSTCYKGTRKFEPLGVLWHSTGANNPTLKRYVQPDDDAPNRDELLKLLGKNIYGNDWNHIKREAGMNFFVGKLADGTVTTVQVMPTNFRPWGCGGALNNTHIQFEICEDNLKDEAYFRAAYKEAAELTAWLCTRYHFNPLGTFQYQGKNVPVIIDHIGSYELGMGSNHGDIRYWFSKYGVTMQDIREEVKRIMDGAEPEPEPTPEPLPDLPMLKFGSSDKATIGTVCYLQKKLGGLDIDGDFGNKTKAAVLEFQKTHGLVADGIVGPRTWAMLERS